VNKNRETIIKDEEPNKYVLDEAKSRDPSHAPLGVGQGPRDLLL